MVDDKSLLKERDPLPDHFDSLEEAAEFWDTHSSADYEDLMEDVEFEIIGKRRKTGVRKDFRALRLPLGEKFVSDIRA